MSAVLDTLRRASGRSSDIVQRVSGLDEAVRAARGRLPDDVVDEAAHVVDRAGARLRLSGEHTVVALAGATGSGKSSLFNLLTGLDLAAVGARRPTTSWTLACAWGPDGAGELLDWLEIPKRHQVNRMGLLDSDASDRELAGLVLLDLPDHDSTEVAHHLEVERLVELADMMIWVLDPQKYADAAIHDRFLRPLNRHADVMLVVLNHIDELAPAEAERCLSDVHRLLAADGLGSVPVIGTSASRGDGIDELRAEIVKRVAQKKSARNRLENDVADAAGRLGELTGDARPGDARALARGDLLDACADAAGVPIVVRAIESATKIRGRQATGWPVTKWFSRFRPDPLKRLHLDQARTDDIGSTAAVSRSSIPRPSPVQGARVDTAVRAVADRVSADLPRPWAAAVRSASVARLDDVADGLDRAVASTDLGVARNPRWWNLVRGLQWVLLLTGIVGLLWLAGLAMFTYLRLPEPPTAEVGEFPVPTLLLLGGLLGGLLLALGSRLATSIAAKRRARTADQRLRSAISGVVDDLVVSSMQTELDAYAACRDGIAAARR